MFACSDSKKQDEKEIAVISIDSSHSKEIKQPTSEFKTCTVDGKVWMSENLNVITFNNGDSIKEAKTPGEWMESGKNSTPAWCYYDNDKKLGKLYNWHAVTDKRGLAPNGFTIPSETDFISLIKNQGGKKLASTKLKSISGWANNQNGSNESGLNILPSGLRSYNGAFSNVDEFAYFWSTTSNRGTNAWHIVLNNKISITKLYSSSKSNGLSVRCVKD